MPHLILLVCSDLLMPLLPLQEGLPEALQHVVTLLLLLVLIVFLLALAVMDVVVIVPALLLVFLAVAAPQSK